MLNKLWFIEENSWATQIKSQKGFPINHLQTKRQPIQTKEDSNLLQTTSFAYILKRKENQTRFAIPLLAS
jgi:hypothetical protein